MIMISSVGALSVLATVLAVLFGARFQHGVDFADGKGRLAL
jgi:hypothetical protein